MVVPAWSTRAVPCSTFSTLALMRLLISLAASALRPARARTSLATTAKPALLTCAGGFHGGVQGQDVGLEGDAVDDADDVGNLAAGSLMSRMVSTTRLTTSPPCTATLEALVASLVGLAGAVGVLVHGAEFAHGGAGLFDGGSLLFGAGRGRCCLGRFRNWPWPPIRRCGEPALIRPEASQSFDAFACSTLSLSSKRSVICVARFPSATCEATAATSNGFTTDLPDNAPRSYRKNDRHQQSQSSHGTNNSKAAALRSATASSSR